MRNMKRRVSRTVTVAVITLAMAGGLTSCFPMYRFRGHRREDRHERYDRRRHDDHRDRQGALQFPTNWSQSER